MQVSCNGLLFCDAFSLPESSITWSGYVLLCEEVELVDGVVRFVEKNVRYVTGIRLNSVYIYIYIYIPTTTTLL